MKLTLEKNKNKKISFIGDKKFKDKKLKSIIVSEDINFGSSSLIKSLLMNIILLIKLLKNFI